MLKKLSFLALILLSIGLIALLVAVVTELLILYPPALVADLYNNFTSATPDPKLLLDKIIYKTHLYTYISYQFWPLWLATLLGGAVAYIIVLRLMSHDNVQNYMARIHSLEEQLNQKSSALNTTSDEHAAMLARIDALYQKSNEAYILLNTTGHIENLNAAAERYLRVFAGKDVSLKTRLIKDILPAYEATGLSRLFTQIVDKKAVWQGELQLHDTNIWLALKMVSAGQAGVILIFRDVSHDHADDATLKTSDALVQQLVHNMPDPTLILDAHWQVQKASTALLTMLGKSMPDVAGAPLNTLFNPEDFTAIKAQLEGGTSFTRDEEMFNFTGQEVWLKWGLQPWQDATGKRGGYILFMEDITELHNTRNRAESKEEGEHALAYQDALTGLPNRQLFNDRLNMALAQAYRQLGKLAIFFLDLDGFKAVNDTLGHDAGDQLLKDVANRLSECVRDTDTVARLGGDEFTVILAIREPKDATIVAKKIIDRINEPYLLDGKEAHVSTSIGIAVYPIHGDGAQNLIKKADTAMYSAKTSGKNQFVIYQDGLEDAA